MIPIGYLRLSSAMGGVDVVHGVRVLLEELFPWQALRLGWANRLPRFLPDGGMNRIRVYLYRALGVSIGRATLMGGAIHFGIGSRPANLTIGELCYLNANIRIDASAAVTIGDGVSIGHDVSIVTSTHTLGSAEFRAGIVLRKAVTIESGAWIAAGATILPGITIGAGSIIAAGAVVTRDVPANTLAAGVPAKVMRSL